MRKTRTGVGRPSTPTADSSTSVAAQDDASIIDAVAPFTGDDCLVAIDAPLIVNNAGGHRLAETVATTATFSSSTRARYPANTDQSAVQEPRGATVGSRPRTRHGPRARERERAIEVYPHPATVVLFELEKTLKYKKGHSRTVSASYSN